VSQEFKVLSYAEHNPATSAATNYGISKYGQSMEVHAVCTGTAPLKARKLESGAIPQFPKEELVLFDEFVKKRSHEYTASCSQIQAKMRNVVGKHGFRASAGWLHDFCIDTNFHGELALRQSIKSILASKATMMKRKGTLSSNM
jgi:hypothetical protein